jgi:hypothetical protein
MMCSASEPVALHSGVHVVMVGKMMALIWRAAGVQARRGTIDAAEKALQDDLDRKRKKHRFGDEQGRIGRRRKGQGKHFQEDVDRFGGDEEDEDQEQVLKKGRKSSSLKAGRDMKDVEAAEDDWEHSEDSDEEAERRKYEHESGFQVAAFDTDTSMHFCTCA